MYIYSVTFKIDKNSEPAWLDFMQRKHIADVLAMGCFQSCSMRKLMEDENGPSATYDIQYTAESEEQYHLYQQKFVPALRTDISNLFEGKFTAQRAFYKIITELPG